MFLGWWPPPRARLMAWGAGSMPGLGTFPHSPSWVGSLSVGVMLMPHMGSRGHSWLRNAVKGVGRQLLESPTTARQYSGVWMAPDPSCPASSLGTPHPSPLSRTPPPPAQSGTAPTSAPGASGPLQTHQPDLTLLALQCRPPLALTLGTVPPHYANGIYTSWHRQVLPKYGFWGQQAEASPTQAEPEPVLEGRRSRGPSG